MAWEQDLFAFLDDLEAQATAAFDTERIDDLVDRSRAEYREVTLAARLAASVDRELALEVLGVGAVRGRLARVSRGWCLVNGAGTDWVVAMAAVTSVIDAADRALPEVAWSPLARLGIGSALRRLADAGTPCQVHLIDGRRHEGVLERIGADFVELLTGERQRVVLVALSALAAVRSRDPGPA